MLEKILQEQIDRLFRDYDTPHTPGCAIGVMQAGELVYSRGYGMADLEKQIPITTDSVFHLASVSKQFTATCIALLEEAGELTLEDDVRRYLAFMPYYGTELKLRHLLFMTNGLEDFYDVTSLIMGIPEGNYFSREDALRILKAANWLKFPPGEQWSYGNSGYFLLACIVEKISGQTLADFAREHIFQPLGMLHTFFRPDRFTAIPKRVSGYARFPRADGQGFTYRLQNELIEICGPGQAWSNVNDLALWEQNFEDNRLGKKDPHLTEKLFTPGMFNDGSATHYGYGQVISRRNGLKVVFHEGGAAGVNTVLYRLPEKRLSVICLANTSDFLTALLRQLGEECYERIAGIVSPWPAVEAAKSTVVAAADTPSNEPAQAALSEADLPALAGNYEDRLTSHIWEVRCEGSAVKVLENYAGSYRLAVEESTDPRQLIFHCKEADLSGCFTRLEGREGAAFTGIQVRQAESLRNFERFLEAPLEMEILKEYEGPYICEPLQVGYRVTAAVEGIRLENLIAENNLLNVVFKPTIRDMFLARYPPVIGWYVVHFRRDAAGRITSFSFRDEVPGREKWVFVKQEK